MRADGNENGTEEDVDEVEVDVDDNDGEEVVDGYKAS